MCHLSLLFLLTPSLVFTDLSLLISSWAELGRGGRFMLLHLWLIFYLSTAGHRCTRDVSTFNSLQTEQLVHQRPPQSSGSCGNFWLDESWEKPGAALKHKLCAQEMKHACLCRGDITKGHIGCGNTNILLHRYCVTMHYICFWSDAWGRNLLWSRMLLKFFTTHYSPVCLHHAFFLSLIILGLQERPPHAKIRYLKL